MEGSWQLIVRKHIMLFLLPEGAFCQGWRIRTIAKILRPQCKAWYKKYHSSQEARWRYLENLDFFAV